MRRRRRRRINFLFLLSGKNSVHHKNFTIPDYTGLKGITQVYLAEIKHLP
jgi:hypothetical protein